MKPAATGLPDPSLIGDGLNQLIAFPIRNGRVDGVASSYAIVVVNQPMNEGLPGRKSNKPVFYLRPEHDVFFCALVQQNEAVILKIPDLLPR